MKKREFFWLTLSLLFIMSCVSAPSIPEWIKKTPQPDSKYTYFVGSSTSTDAATALNDATANLIAGIMQYMGVSISVSSSAEAKASLNDYQAQITQTVKTESNGRLAGFEVAEKYIQTDKKAGKYTVYVLARYETKELQKEKARIEALFQEKSDAVAIPEQKGDAAVSEGRILDAIRFYAEAMTAAAGSDIDNAQVKLERNAKKASSIAATLKLTMSSIQMAEIPFGARLPSFSARLIMNKGGLEYGVAGAPIVVTYPKKLASGRVGSSTLQVFTDQNGNVAFEVPAIDIAGKYQIAVRLDFASISDMLASMPSWTLPYINALEDDLSGIALFTNYVVISSAKTIPTAIGVYAKPSAYSTKLDVAVCASSLKEALVQQGFSLFDASIPSNINDTDIAQLKAIAPGNAKRFIIASIDVGSITKDAEYIIASVSGTINVYDLASGASLYAASKSAQGMGMSELEAISSALRTLGGQIFAKGVLSALP